MYKFVVISDDRSSNQSSKDMRTRLRHRDTIKRPSRYAESNSSKTSGKQQERSPAEYFMLMRGNSKYVENVTPESGVSGWESSKQPQPSNNSGKHGLKRKAPCSYRKKNSSQANFLNKIEALNEAGEKQEIGTEKDVSNQVPVCDELQKKINFMNSLGLGLARK